MIGSKAEIIQKSVVEAGFSTLGNWEAKQEMRNPEQETPFPVIFFVTQVLPPDSTFSF